MILREMDNFWVTYNGVVGSSAKVEASLLKMPTPPCKLADNHKVINLSATHSVTAWLVEQPCV